MQEHNATYNRLLSSVTSANTLDKALVALDPYEYSTGKDGVSIIDLTTGLEVAYYDMLTVMDYSRTPRPSGSAPGQSDTMDDWLHINQSYINETNTF